MADATTNNENSSGKNGQLARLLPHLLPILVLLFALVLKVASSADQVKNQTDSLAFVVQKYGPEMWIDVLVTAWVLAVATYLRKGMPSRSGSDRVLYFAPIIGSLLCIVTIPLLPLFYPGPPGDWTRIYLPLIFSFLTLLFVSLNAQGGLS
jgi:hypothetical protein